MSTSSAPGFSVRVILSLAALAIIFGVTLSAVRNHQPVAVDTDVSQQRLSNKADYQKTNAEVLGSYGVVDKDKGVYRIPVAQARAKALADLKAAQHKD